MSAPSAVETTAFFSEGNGEAANLTRHAPTAEFLTCTTITASTADVSLKAAPAAGFRLVVTHIEISNTSGMDCGVMIYDGAAGTQWLANVLVPSGGTVMKFFDFLPTCKADASTAIFGKCSAAVSSIRITLQGYTAPTNLPI